jgi:hypothetical protein
MITPEFIRPAVLTTPTTIGDVNDSFSPVYDFIEAIDNSLSIVVTTDYTVPNNTIGKVFVDCSGGAVTITLPLVANRVQPIQIKKIDSTKNALTITCSGSDKVERTAVPENSPTVASYSVIVPNYTVELLAVSGAYRVIHEIKPSLFFTASRESNQNIAATSTVKLTPTSEVDPYNMFNIATSEFTTPISATYKFEGHILISQSTPTPGNLYISTRISTPALDFVQRIAEQAVPVGGTNMYSFCLERQLNAGVYIFACGTFGAGAIIGQSLYKMTLVY